MCRRVDPGQASPQALCMCPTRELAVQNLQVLTKMALYTGIKAVSTAGEKRRRGERITEQVPSSHLRWLFLPSLDLTIICFCHH